MDLISSTTLSKHLEKHKSVKNCKIICIYVYIHIPLAKKNLRNLQAYKTHCFNYHIVEGWLFYHSIFHTVLKEGRQIASTLEEKN